MIVFKNIKMKNFMSIGNTVVEFNYQTGLTYVYGENHDVPNDNTLLSNGSGKTVILVDALLFVLYGKTQRKIKRSEILNLQNGSDCVVVLHIVKDDVEYIIERGMKPDKIFITKDGIVQSEEVAKKLSNKIIEDDILDGISFDVFKNLIVLNGTTSKHFFEYTKQEKRTFINQVFRLGFLDFLQSDLTKDAKDKKISFDQVLIQKEAKKKELERLSSLLDARTSGEVHDIETDIQTAINTETEKISVFQNNLLTIPLEGDIIEHEKKCGMATDRIIDINNQIMRLSTMIEELRSQYTSVQADYSRIAENSVCTQCTQVIPDSLKKFIFKNLNQQCEDLVNQANKHKIKKESFVVQLSQMNQWVENAKKLLTDYQTTTNNISMTTVLLEQQKERLLLCQDPKQKTDLVKEEIKSAETELNIIEDKSSDLDKEFQIIKISRDLVGGKNFYGYYIGVFRSYLNKYINEYLAKMLSSHRVQFNNDLEADVFEGELAVYSYDNLSTGEKAKIDIALLLSFFDVLQYFHRMETSLLILDEVLDSGLDSVGVEMLHKILRDKISKNKSLGIYVVSHKNSENTFAEKEGINKLVFEKRLGFTTIQGEKIDS